jgi:hypothetical protein
MDYTRQNEKEGQHKQDRTESTPTTKPMIMHNHNETTARSTTKAGEQKKKTRKKTE